MLNHLPNNQQMSLGLRYIAKRAGVSLGTVSNVLNHPELVSPLRRDAVSRVLKETNFVHEVPNVRKVHLLVKSLGVMIPTLTNPFYVDLCNGFQSEATSEGYGVLICSMDEDRNMQEFYASLLLERSTAGVLISPIDQSDKYLDKLSARKIPVVLHGPKQFSGNMCSISGNHHYGGELGIQHLYDLGHRDVVWVTLEDRYPQIIEREAGVVAAAERLGMHLRMVCIPKINAAYGEAAVDKILDLELETTAIFCANDYTAIGVICGLSARGIKTPDEISVLGYDGISSSASSVLPLSTISQPVEQLGREAAKLLIQEISSVKNHVHQNLSFEPELKARATTTRPRLKLV
jgi:DNA-binding LacI/PurR family transcriptional regulator